MKRVACPKCGAYLTFDENKYPVGRILVFECAACKKSFKVRVKPSDTPTEAKSALAYLSVIENSFHNQQVIPLYMGENIIGRYVKGTPANAPIVTTDPSIDTTHCIITVKRNKKQELCFVLRDAPSNTGTFYHDTILKDADRINLEDDAIITIGATSMIFSLPKEKEE